MAWEIENFWDKKWSNGFDKRPWDAWRPRKWASLILHTLKEMWIEKNITRNQIDDMYLQMGQLTQKELKKIFKDEKQPVWAHVIAKSLTGRDSFKTMETMLDRTFWKSTTKIEVEDNRIIHEDEFED